MAGIGFTLRKILKGESLNHVFRAYLYAGIISSGPWIISIIALTIIYFISTTKLTSNQSLFLQFQTAITYLMAISLIISGLLQYAYTRYISDLMFKQQEGKVLANTFGAIVLNTLTCIPIGILYSYMALKGTSPFFQFSNVALLTVFTNIWLVANLLSGLKIYRSILFSFLLGYGVSILGCLVATTLGEMLFGFLIGQTALLFSLILIITFNHFSLNLLSLNFMKKGRMYPSLILSGLFFNASIWADKFLFWFYPNTGEIMVGALRASLIYDLPMYLSFFLLIPGLAVFLFRMETDFVHYYETYYSAIRDGGNLTQINTAQQDMVDSARTGFIEIIKIQTFFTLLGFLYSKDILTFFHFPTIHTHLFQLDMLSVDLLILFMAILNVHFYLDERKATTMLTLVLLTLNITFTLASLHLGIYFYGTGFLGALIVTNFVGLCGLNQAFEQLTYKTFMGSTS